MEQLKIYRNDLDGLKGIAILSVIFYHLGIFQSGYLGVDLFLVINGFLIVPSVCRQLENRQFSYFTFLGKRLIRLAPLTVLACFLCLGLGTLGMLPNSYESLGNYVVSTSVFSTNILSAAVSRNYWDASNDYKPLMHMWYIGVIVHFYVIFPLIMKLYTILIQKCSVSYKSAVNVFLAILGIVSLILYLMPNPGNNSLLESLRFYSLPTRLFEIIFGGIIGYNLSFFSRIQKFRWISPVLLVLLLGCLGICLCTFDVHNLGSKMHVVGTAIEYSAPFILPSVPLLLLTVILSCVVIAQDNSINVITRNVLTNKPLCFIGKMSFSLFVWHQIVIAFYRYYVSHELSLFFVLAYLGVVFGISFFTYYFIEKKIRLTKRVILTTVAFNVLAAGMGFYVFLTSGIIRDVPELDLQKKPFFEHVSSVKSYRLNGNHGQYCDRIYAYENRTYTLEETTEPKARVLVLGNSFARDMGNVLLESSSANKILLSYIYYDNNTSLTDNSLQIIHNSDTIFVFMSKSDLPQHFWETLSPEARVYGIGTKNYGQSLGAVYRKRYLSDYYDQTVAMAAGYEALNVSWKSEWGDHYIDFMSPVTTKFGRVRVFTDDHRFISQDCIHLTQAGAKYYARILDIDRLIFGDPL